MEKEQNGQQSLLRRGGGLVSKEDRIMKKIFISMAAAAMVLASCQKAEFAGESEGIRLDVTGFASTANPGCATFVFATADYTTGDDTDTYAFTLIKTSSVKAKVSYSVSKALQSPAKMKGIKLAYSGFSHDYVDLGLSVKWATCIVGATTPEEYGDYFAWGETAPYYRDGVWSTSTTWGGTSTAKTSYNWANYNGSTSFTEWSPAPYDASSKVLTSAYDAATVNWGEEWRMPTSAEWEELLNTSNCTWTWTTQNNVNGYKVTSKKTGYTDKSIFLPAAGDVNGTSLNWAGTYGYYWSSSLDGSDSSKAWRLDFYNGSRKGYSRERYKGSRVYAVHP